MIPHRKTLIPHRKIFLLLVALCVMLPAFQSGAEPLKIVTGTSLIDDIVRDLTEGRAQTVVLVPGSSCPGHDALKTSDFVFAAGADLFLVHAFQQNSPQLAGMLQSVQNRPLVVLRSKGNWLVPEAQKQAVRDIAAALEAACPDLAPLIGERAKARLGKIDQAGAECAEKLAAVRGRGIVCAAMQAEFLRWAGLEVMESYNRAEEMTPKDVALLIDRLRGRPVAGVVDNYQSGAAAGLPLALELKVPHLVLSNFPGSAEDTPDYFTLLRGNVARLIRLGG
ncbi:MAG: zinc ABC transporter substrate-binding protein [Desulfovibrio sp.]|jgi:zinc transport system substrate-binding protein|nr:zinc ABC transporter substrate-binding protein [Desulfovibrio sp.]